MWRLSPGSARRLLLSPHPTVRNNLQHCRALCHLTLHGRNSQPAEGLNKGRRGRLYAWKNSHPTIITVDFSPSIMIFLLVNFFIDLSVKTGPGLFATVPIGQCVRRKGGTSVFAFDSSWEAAPADRSQISEMAHCYEKHHNCTAALCVWPFLQGMFVYEPFFVCVCPLLPRPSLLMGCMLLDSASMYYACVRQQRS